LAFYGRAAAGIRPINHWATFERSPLFSVPQQGVKCRFIKIPFSSQRWPLSTYDPARDLHTDGMHLVIGVVAQLPLGGQDIFVRKLFMNSYIILTKCPNFYDICPKMPEFYTIIARKCFPIFFWGGGHVAPPLPSPTVLRLWLWS